MKTNKSLLILSIGLVLILALSFAITAKNDHNNGSNNSNNGNPRMTYGKCVANLTKDKNACYKTAQQTYQDCQRDIKNMTNTMRANNQTINNTQIIVLRKNCLLTERTELQACKNGFKNEKESCTQFKKNN